MSSAEKKGKVLVKIKNGKNEKNMTKRREYTVCRRGDASEMNSHRNPNERKRQNGQVVCCFQS